MSERTGLGPLEVSVIRSCDDLEDRVRHRCAKASSVLERIEVVDSLGPRYAWDALRDLARNTSRRVCGQLVSVSGEAHPSWPNGRRRRIP